MEDKIKRLKDKLKNSKGARILFGADINESEEYLTSPAYDLNRILSGSLYKSIVEKSFFICVGPEKSFKSSFMAIQLGEAQKNGYTGVVIDAEGAWDRKFCERWGINFDELIKIHSMFVDDILVNLTEFINWKEEKLAIVLDSVGALERKKIIKDGIKGAVKADQGQLQKEIKKMLKMMVQIIKYQDGLGFASAHYYGSPSVYGNTDEIGGGKYLKYAGDYIVSLKKYNLYENPRGESLKDKGEIIGTNIKAATLKNRMYPEAQEATLEIDFFKGINKLAGLLDLSIELGLIEQSGAWYLIKETDEKIQGYKNLEEWFKNDTKLIEKIEEKLSETGYSSINTNIKQMCEMLNGGEEEVKKEKGDK